MRILAEVLLIAVLIGFVAVCYRAIIGKLFSVHKKKKRKTGSRFLS